MLLGNPDSISLETSKRRPIDNIQSNELTVWERSENARIERQWGPMVTSRSGATGIYNCHGLTFAARRTCVWEPSEIEKILEDDAYKEVQEVDVLPGDIIIYREDNGEIIHSGLVVQRPNEATFNLPLVLSKWGKGREYLHVSSQCPYNPRYRYYRVTYA